MRLKSRVCERAVEEGAHQVGWRGKYQRILCQARQRDALRTAGRLASLHEVKALAKKRDSHEAGDRLVLKDDRQVELLVGDAVAQGFAVLTYEAQSDLGQCPTCSLDEGPREHGSEGR